MNRLILPLLLATMAALGVGCTQQHVADAALNSDLRHPTGDATTSQDTPASIRGIGATDAAGAVLWSTGQSATAYLLRPGLPDAVFVYSDFAPEPTGTPASAFAAVATE